MDEIEIKRCIDSGMSQREIAEKFNKSHTAVRYWLEKFNLRTNPHSYARVILEGHKICIKCNVDKSLDEFHQYTQKDGRRRSNSYCKPCSIRDVLDRQTNFKLQCLDYKGGRHCIKCGYNKSHVSLDFHHRFDSSKEFAISKYKSYKFIDAVKNELDKCDVLCSNCHRETHHELSKQRNRRQEV